MVGYKMMRPRGEAATFEDEVLGPSTLTDEQLRMCKAKGTRRMGRVFPQVSCTEAPEGVRLVFTLPTGSYATILLREFMKDAQSGS
jgi:tRNA(Glu) U13 pseudouridine synthase TruD